MQTIKNIGWGIFGLICLFFVKEIAGFGMWLSTLPFSIGLQLVGAGALVAGIYAGVKYGAKKFASLFE